MYRLMGDHADFLPPRLLAILPRMRDADWLSAYRSADVVAAALDRIAMRLTRENTLTGSGAELGVQYAGYEADFFEFLPAARRYAEDCRRRRGEIG